MKISKKILAIIMAASLLIGGTYIEAPMEVMAEDEVTYAVTPERLVSDEAGEAENDPLYEKYNSPAAQLNQATAMLGETAWGEGLTHDPRFDNYD